MSIKPNKFESNRPTFVSQADHGGKRTREGTKSGIGRLERVKHGNGIKDGDDRSNGIEILMTNTFSKINPIDPLRLSKQVT